MHVGVVNLNALVSFSPFVRLSFFLSFLLSVLCQILKKTFGNTHFCVSIRLVIVLLTCIANASLKM